MAKLLIAYDPRDLMSLPPQGNRPPGMLGVEMTLADGLAGRDIYEVARKLAELLLEQI